MRANVRERCKVAGVKSSEPGMLGGLGLDDFYRYQAPLFRQRP